MTRKKQAGGAVRLPEETIQLLRKLAKKLDKSQTWIIENLLDMADVHDLLNEGWQERLTAALEKGMWHIQRRKHFESKEKCAGLRAAEKKWKCIQGRPNKTPMIRNLAEDYDEALNLCEGCTETLEPILKNYELQERIAQLEKTAQIKASVSFKAPICHKGAVLTADGTEFRSCPKTAEKTVSVENWCKKYSSGLPCQLYGEVVIAVADKASQNKVNL